MPSRHSIQTQLISNESIELEKIDHKRMATIPPPSQQVTQKSSKVLLPLLNEVLIFPIIPRRDARNRQAGPTCHLSRWECAPQTPPLAFSFHLMRIGRRWWRAGCGTMTQMAELRISPPNILSTMATLDSETVVDGRVGRTATHAGPPMGPATYWCSVLVGC